MRAGLGRWSAQRATPPTATKKKYPPDNFSASTNQIDKAKGICPTYFSVTALAKVTKNKYLPVISLSVTGNALYSYETKRGTLSTKRVTPIGIQTRRGIPPPNPDKKGYTLTPRIKSSSLGGKTLTKNTTERFRSFKEVLRACPILTIHTCSRFKREL